MRTAARTGRVETPPMPSTLQARPTLATLVAASGSTDGASVPQATTLLSAGVPTAGRSADMMETAPTRRVSAQARG